ncbi:MAG: MFS transporter, partial [Candidatus Competibacteraceae bacterium]|nr:MFS transporter [Candidatus Competibacteraceae bacterium]
FLSFALFQLPLGILLDRYGPRRVEAGLLLFAALGALLFAISDSLDGLMLGRALIGLGVSACLMAGFKAFVLWFPASKLPAVNGWVMTAGGLGALTATTPVEAALELTDWRGVFGVLAVVTLGVAVVIFKVVPEQAGHHHRETLREQFRGVGHVFASVRFWRVAPLTMMSQAAFLSIQSLWVGPWLADVAGLPRETVAGYLLLTAAAMVAGFLGIGSLAYRLSHRGIPPLVVAGSGMLLFMVAQLGLTLNWTAAALPLWMLFGFFGTAGILPYAVLSQSFPAHLAGRVNAAINVLVFTASFVCQWGIGAIIDLWSGQQGYAPQGYQAAFALVLGLQLLAFLWFLGGGWRRQT